MTTDEQIRKRHFEEILLILNICNCDTSVYHRSELVNFAECIEGRVDILFQKEKFRKYADELNPSEAILFDCEKLRSFLMGLFSPQWHKKIDNQNPAWKEIKTLAKSISDRLGIKYIEPYEFIETHFEDF